MATQRMQIDARYLPKNVWRPYGGMMKFGGYPIGIAQIHDEIKEKLNFRTFPNSKTELTDFCNSNPVRYWSFENCKNER